MLQALTAEEAFPAQVPLAQVSLVQVLPIPAASIQAPQLISLAPLPSEELGRVNIMSQSAPLAPLAPVEHGCGKPGKLPERVDKFDTLTDKNTEITGLLEKDVSKVVTPKEFVTPDKVVTPEEIPSDTQKGHPVIQAYNDKDKNLMLTQLSTKLLYGVPEAGNHCFAIYHPHYKEKLGMTESAYDPCLLYSNELVDNPTRTFSCAARLGLVGKKGEPPKVVLDLLSHPLKPPSLLLSLTLSKMRPAMFEYLAMFNAHQFPNGNQKIYQKPLSILLLPPKLPPKQLNSRQTISPY